MKNRKNRFLAFGMGCVLGFSCVFSSYATNADLKDAKNKMSSLQEEKKKVQDTLKQLEGLKSDAAAYVKELDKKLTSLDAELSQLEKDISAKESQIKDTKAELEEAKAVEKEQYASMKLRIQYMYENGNVSFADSIMTSKDASQLLNRAEYASQIASYDRKMLKEYQAAKEKVNQKEQDLEAEHANLLELQDTTEAKQASVQELMSSKQKELSSYNSQISSAQSSIDQYDADIKAQENQMKAIEAEMKRREEEARKKAEAQKKAEEDAVTARKNQEIQTRKNTFLSALRDVENLEYQSSEAESLVQNAISKLSLVETYEEAASYKERLQKAIDRIATLPTESEWQAAQQQKEAAKAEAQAAEQEQIGIEQQSLKNYLNQAKRSWNTWSNQPPANPAAGPGSSSQSVIAAPTTGRND